MSKKLIVVLLQTILIFGCKDTNLKVDLGNDDCIQGEMLPTEDIPSTIKTITMDNAFKELPRRQADFVESLEITLSVNSPSNLDYKSFKKTSYLNVNIYFENISNTDLIMRLPKAIGFSNRSVATIDDGFYDLGFELYTIDKKPVVIHSERGEFIDENVNLSDFAVVYHGEKSCINYELETTQVYIDGVEYDLLPRGEYLLYAKYQNYLIGNIIPVIETPPPNIDESERINWELSHKKQIDLNAWVGMVESKTTKFIVP